MGERFNISSRVLFSVLLLLFLTTNTLIYYNNKYQDSNSRSNFAADAAVCASNLRLNIKSVVDISMAQANNYLYFFAKSDKSKNAGFTAEYNKIYDVTKLNDIEFGNVYFNSKVSQIPQELNEINNILYYNSLDNYSKFENTLGVYYSTDNYIVIYPKIEIEQILPIGEKLDFSKMINLSIENVLINKQKGIYNGYDLNIFPDNEQLCMQVTAPVIDGEVIKGFLTSNFVITSMMEKLVFNDNIVPYVAIEDYILSYENNILNIHDKDYLIDKYSKNYIKNNKYSYTVMSENDLPIEVSYMYKSSEAGLIDYLIGNSILVMIAVFTFAVLSRYNKKVKQLEAVKTDFLLTVSHEVKNPLMLISGHAQSVINCNDIKMFQNSVKLIQKESNRLTNLINNILYYLRTDEQNIILLKEKIEIRELFEEIISLHSGTNKLHIILKIDSSLSYFYADREKIRRVILNLIINALEATEEGEIVLYAESVKDGLKIGVKDTGIGINDKEINKIFDVFYTNKKDGSGLGLAICNQIILKHGGKFKVTSCVGKGSNFSFVLPIE